MAQTVLITLTVAGADTGPFDLYSDADGYVAPFETGVAKASLVSGYTSVLVPDLATIIRVQSTSVLCENYVDLPISGLTTTTTTTAEPTTTTTTTTEEPTTTTTTSTSTSTTTTTTTEVPTTTTTTTAAPAYYVYDVNNISYVDPVDACNNSDGNLTLYALEPSALTVSVFYTDIALTIPYTGTGSYYRFQRQGFGGSIRGQILANGSVQNAATCP